LFLLDIDGYLGRISVLDVDTMWTLYTALSFTLFQFLAHRAMPLTCLAPTAGLIRAPVAPYLVFALFSDAERVGGRGISDFLDLFFPRCRFSSFSLRRVYRVYKIVAHVLSGVYHTHHR
jgi:hypothetical protein